MTDASDRLPTFLSLRRVLCTGVMAALFSRCVGPRRAYSDCKAKKEVKGP
jgi:hypothetical protein